MSVWKSRVPPPRGPEFEAQLRTIAPRTLLTCYHSKNANVVVFEAQTNVYGHFDRDKPILSYWLVLDPEQVQDLRKKGRMHNYHKLGMLEKKFFFAYKFELLAPDRMRWHPKYFPQYQLISTLLPPTIPPSPRVETLWVNAPDGISRRVHCMYSQYRWQNFQFKSGRKNLDCIYLVCDALQPDGSWNREYVPVYGTLPPEVAQRASSIQVPPDHEALDAAAHTDEPISS